MKKNLETIPWYSLGVTLWLNLTLIMETNENLS